jgi:hypothetical protein
VGGLEGVYELRSHPTEGRALGSSADERTLRTFERFPECCREPMWHFVQNRQRHPFHMTFYFHLMEIRTRYFIAVCWKIVI